MSRPSNKAPPAAVSAAVVGPDGAEPTKPMTLTGVVRTTKGYAVAIATRDDAGNVSVKLGRSQSEKVYVALEHRNMLARLANSL